MQPNQLGICVRNLDGGGSAGKSMSRKHFRSEKWLAEQTINSRLANMGLAMLAQLWYYCRNLPNDSRVHTVLNPFPKLKALNGVSYARIFRKKGLRFFENYISRH